MLRDALWEVVLLVELHATCCCLKRVSERKNRIKMTIYDIVITCHCIIVCVHNCTYMCIHIYIYIYIYTVYRPNHQTFNSHDSKSNIVIPAPSRTWRRITEPLLRRARSSCQGVTGSRSVKHGKIDFQNHGMLGEKNWVLFEARLCGSSPKNDKLVPASGRCTCTELAIRVQ